MKRGSKGSKEMKGYSNEKTSDMKWNKNDKRNER
jgi:hypothetical protein